MSSTNTNNDGATGAGVTVAGPTAQPIPGPYHVYGANRQWPGIEAPEASVVIWGDVNEHCGVQGETHDQAVATAHLLASSWSFLAACTPERLDALDDMLQTLDDRGRTDWTFDAVQDLLSALRAAVAGAGGGGRTP